MFWGEACRVRVTAWQWLGAAVAGAWSSRRWAPGPRTVGPRWPPCPLLPCAHGSQLWRALRLAQAGEWAGTRLGQDAFPLKYAFSVAA